jgi:hypothetical protein
MKHILAGELWSCAGAGDRLVYRWERGRFVCIGATRRRRRRGQP